MAWEHRSRLPQIPHSNMVIVFRSIYSNRTKESHKSTHFLNTSVDYISSTGYSKEEKPLLRASDASWWHPWALSRWKLRAWTFQNIWWFLVLSGERGYFIPDNLAPTWIHIRAFVQVMLGIPHCGTHKKYLMIQVLTSRCHRPHAEMNV